MRYTVSAPAILFIAAFFLPVYAQVEIKTAKIGVIDLEEIAVKSTVGKAAQDKLRSWFETKKRDLDAKERSLQQEVATLENQRSVMSAEAYAQRKNELEQRTLAFNQERDAAQRELERRQEEALDEFAQVVGPVIEQIGEELGLTVILDRRTGVYYFDREVDITSIVIDRLNSAQSATPPEQ
jgi:Skp family chaperone for outer membrane proteins